MAWRGEARGATRANASETVSVIEPTTATRKRYFILGNVARRESSSGGRRRSSVSLRDIDLETLVSARAESFVIREIKQTDDSSTNFSGSQLFARTNVCCLSVTPPRNEGIYRRGTFASAVSRSLSPLILAPIARWESEKPSRRKDRFSARVHVKCSIVTRCVAACAKRGVPRLESTSGRSLA